MNAYTRNMNPDRPDRNSSSGGKKRIARFAAGVGGLILMIFFAISGQMHLRVEIERLNKHATRVQMEIAQLNVQCTNLRNRKEHLTGWQNIHARIKQYRLGLRDADPRQISYISLNAPRGVSRTLRPVRTSQSRDLNLRREYVRNGR